MKKIAVLLAMIVVAVLHSCRNDHPQNQSAGEKEKANDSVSLIMRMTSDSIPFVSTSSKHGNDLYLITIWTYGSEPEDSSEDGGAYLNEKWQRVSLSDFLSRYENSFTQKIILVDTLKMPKELRSHLIQRTDFMEIK